MEMKKDEIIATLAIIIEAFALCASDKYDTEKVNHVVYLASKKIDTSFYNKKEVSNELKNLLKDQLDSKSLSSDPYGLAKRITENIVSANKVDTSTSSIKDCYNKDIMKLLKISIMEDLITPLELLHVDADDKEKMFKTILETRIDERIKKCTNKKIKQQC